MRSRLAVLLGLLVAGCATEPPTAEAVWTEATVVAYAPDRELLLHMPFRTVRVRAVVENETDQPFVVVRSGENLRDGHIEGAGPGGRFVLVTADTTIAFYVRRAGPPDSLAVPPGETATVDLVADTFWLTPLAGDPRPTFVEQDSASVADFFLGALETGRIAYERPDGPPIPVRRAPEAEVTVESPFIW